MAENEDVQGYVCDVPKSQARGTTLETVWCVSEIDISHFNEKSTCKSACSVSEALLLHQDVCLGVTRVAMCQHTFIYLRNKFFVVLP